MPISAVAAADLELLRKYDTPTVCNVLELFDCRPRHAGYCDGRIRACFPNLPPMVGYASTATFRSSAPPRSGTVYGSLDAQVASFAELPGSPVVVFQDLDDPVAAATFGEVMCTTYQKFGAVGLITSGAGRDLDQVEALRFPCFTSGTICAHGYCHIPNLNACRITAGGVTIHPGDLLHGDRNGVSTIPNALAAACGSGRAPDYMAAEAIFMDYLKSPTVTPRRLRTEARQACKERIDAYLQRRLKA